MDPVQATSTSNTASAPATPSVTPAGSSELSAGAKAGASIAIGIGNVCCGPTCYGCPTILSSMIGIILYFAWKKDKPESAKLVLTVTLITGAIGLAFIGLAFALGMAGAIMDSANF